MGNKIPDSAINSIREAEFLRSQLSVAMPDYSAAVKRLSFVASSDTGAAAAAAQVLLSCYNDRNWQLNVMDLGSLDYRLMQDAFIVMRGWLILREYPHNVIDDGKEVFDCLERKWHHLNASKRYADRYADRIELNNDERRFNFIVKRTFLDTVFRIIGASRLAGYMVVDFAAIPKAKQLEQMQHIIDAVIDHEYRDLFTAEDLLNKFELTCDRCFPEPLRRSASSTPSETLDRYLRENEPSSSLIQG